MHSQDIGGNVTQDTFLDYIEEYRLADESVAGALKERRVVRQKIKESGFDIDAFDRSRAEAEKSGELREEQHRQFMRNMHWLGKPVGEGYLDPETVEQEEAMINPAQRERVNEHGFVAGYEGKGASVNPWRPGSTLAGDWEAGWQRGFDTRTTDGEDAPKRKPGRPPGARNKPKAPTHAVLASRH